MGLPQYTGKKRGDVLLLLALAGLIIDIIRFIWECKDRQKPTPPQPPTYYLANPGLFGQLYLRHRARVRLSGKTDKWRDAVPASMKVGKRWSQRPTINSDLETMHAEAVKRNV